jgi:hypothetical protein
MEKVKLLTFAGVLAAIVLGSAGSAAAASSCSYKGRANALPTSGAPVLVYANGDASPSGFIGISDGSGDNYGQLSGDSSGIQAEGKSASLGQSGWVKSDGSMGSC